MPDSILKYVEKTRH